MSISKEISILVFLLLVSSIDIPAYALQSSVIDPNLQITLEYPDVIKQREKFVLSSIIKATADQISNITVSISSPELNFANNTFSVAKLAKDSSFGNNFELETKNNTPDGRFVVNIQISYYIKGLFDANPIRNTSTHAFYLNAQSSPILSFDIQSPNNVFSGEPFSIKATIKNQGAKAQNVQVIAYSDDISLEGKKSFLLSSLDPGQSTNIEFMINTPKDLDIPTHATIHINGTYFDDLNQSHSIQDSVNIFARHRGILEIGDANGIWVGTFFIAPVVGVGTIVSSAIGFFIFLWHFRNRKKQKKNRKQKT